MDTKEPAHEPYVPPDRLPEPMAVSSPKVVPVIAFTLVTSLVLGVALFAVSQLVYIYVLYNIGIGIALGLATGAGIRMGRYTNRMVVLALTVLGTIVTYLMFNYSLFYWFMRDYDGSPSASYFLTFLRLRAEHDTLMRDIKPEAIGNTIVWLIEAGITGFVAFKVSLAAIRDVHMETVPEPVTAFVLHMISENRRPEEIKEELSKRGWMRPEDQKRATLAATSAIAAMREEKES